MVQDSSAGTNRIGPLPLKIKKQNHKPLRRQVVVIVMVPGVLVMLLAWGTLTAGMGTAGLLPPGWQAVVARPALAADNLQGSPTKQTRQSRITALFTKTEELKANDRENSAPEQITLLQSWLLQAQASLTANENKDVDRLLRRCEHQVRFIEATIARAAAEKTMEQMKMDLEARQNQLAKHHADIIRLTAEKETLKQQEREMLYSEPPPAYGAPADPNLGSGPAPAPALSPLPDAGESAPNRGAAPTIPRQTTQGGGK